MQAIFDHIKGNVERASAEAQTNRYALAALIAWLGARGDMDAEGFIAFLNSREPTEVIGSAESLKLIATMADVLLFGRDGSAPMLTVIEGGRSEDA